MDNNNQLSFTGRLRSVKCAVKGISIMIASQHNAWIHAVATVAVTVVGIYFKLNRYDWCWIILASIAVWTAETLNTAFEFLTDVAARLSSARGESEGCRGGRGLNLGNRLGFNRNRHHRTSCARIIKNFLPLNPKGVCLTLNSPDY